MATVHFVVSDTDGPPPEGGTCQINCDGDTVTGLVTAVNFWNTTIWTCTFDITRNSDQRTQRVNIPPGTGSPAAPQTVTPPFHAPGGNWTPAIEQNPRNGVWGLSGCDISLASTR